MYFDNCISLEEAKALYHELVKKHHPDAGGDTRTMQDINAEYARFQTESAKADQRTRQQAAHAEGRKSAADFHDLDEVADVLRVKIEAVLNLGLDAELCGLWIWVTGDTKPHKDALGRNGLGFKWSHDKEAWYFAGVPSFNRQHRTLEEIRAMHGSQTFKSAPRKEVEALPA